MPFLIPIAQAVASAIMAAITAVAAAIGPILTAVGSAVIAIASIVATITVTVATAMLTAVTWFGSWVVSQVGWLTDWLVSGARAAYTWMSGWVASVSNTFQEILAVIHFKTILEIHSIVYIVSPQYRAMMVKVYAAIGNASKALGLGPLFLTLAIQNTRNLVLDVSSMMGQRYDLAQVSWLGTMSKYLDHFNKYAYKYQNNPEAVFWDLAELIERPSLDAKGAFQQSIISGLDTALKFAKTVGEGLSTIGIDIEKLYDDFPQFVKNQIPDPGTVFWDNMDGFLNDWYRPTIQRLDGAIGEWQGRLTEAQGRVSELAEKLRKPGDLIKAIDQLPTSEREQQEDIFYDISSRRSWRLINLMAPTFNADFDELEVKSRKPIPPTTVSPPLSYEPVTATVTGPGTITPRSTWFVGDF